MGTIKNVVEFGTSGKLYYFVPVDPQSRTK
jgi:hypothetical protein